MASRAQRRKRYLRRRAHAAQVPRYGSGDFFNVKFDPTLIGHLAGDVLAFVDRYGMTPEQIDKMQKTTIRKGEHIITPDTARRILARAMSRGE